MPFLWALLALVIYMVHVVHDAAVKIMELSHSIRRMNRREQNACEEASADHPFASSETPEGCGQFTALASEIGRACLKHTGPEQVLVPGGTFPLLPFVNDTALSAQVQ